MWPVVGNRPWWKRPLALIELGLVVTCGAGATALFATDHAGWASAVLAGMLLAGLLIPMLAESGHELLDWFAERREASQRSLHPNAPGYVVPVWIQLLGAGVAVATVQGIAHEELGWPLARRWPLLAALLIVQLAVQSRVLTWLRPGPGNVQEMRKPRRSLDYPMPVARVLCSHEVQLVNAASIRRTGFLIDDVWPRLLLVIPGWTRRRHALVELRIAFTRTAVAAVATALPQVALMVGDRGLSEIVVVTAPFALAFVVLLGSARSQVTSAYAERALVADLYRFDLAQALRIQLPNSQDEFRKLGNAFTQPGSDWEILAAGRAELAKASRSDLKRLEEMYENSKRHHKDLDRLIGRVFDELDDVQQQLRTTVRESVTEAMSGPPLVNFTGYLAVEVVESDGVQVEGSTILAPSEAEVSVVASLIADARARDAAAERGIDDDRFLALEPFHIERGRTENEVAFDIVVDSATMVATPRRRRIVVPQSRGEQWTHFGLFVPRVGSEHEVWLQLYQSGHLVQAILLIINARREG